MIMECIEVMIKVPERELEDTCCKLEALGASGFVIESEEDFKQFLENNRQYWDYVDESLEAKYAGASCVKFYLEDNAEGAGVLETVRNAGFSPETKRVCDSDWENNWKQFYKPLEIGERLIVVPEWEEVPDKDRIPLRLDPGLMFGTGSHPTTRMCLAALEKYAGEGKRVLDLGCGSGILGIGAMVLGCKACVGCDIDPKAPDIAAFNASLNGIGNDVYKVYAGDIIGDAGLRKSLGKGYDIVLANIVSDVIIPLAPLVRAFMAPDAVFITSGIIDGREDDVRLALERNGFEIKEHLHEEEWHCFVCK